MLQYIFIQRWKALTKGETLNYCNLTFQWFNMKKLKEFVFKNAWNWAGFTLQTRYLVGKFIFNILSTCCVHQDVYYVLLGKVRAMVNDS